MRRFSLSSLIALLLGGLSLAIAVFFTANYAITDNVTSNNLTYDDGLVSNEDIAEVLNTYPNMPTGIFTPETTYILAMAHLHLAFEKGIFSNDARPDAKAAEQYLLSVVSTAPANASAWYYLSLLQFVQAKDPQRMADYYMMSVNNAPRLPFAVYQRLFFSGIILSFVDMDDRKKLIDQIHTAWIFGPEATIHRLPPKLAPELLEEALIQDKNALMELKEKLRP
ncbi:MAG: hypothetical protein EB060_07840 [Proteobacteria bacterium]|nr:hypothetical protein [Pseudomonadota bacterium]